MIDVLDPGQLEPAESKKHMDTIRTLAEQHGVPEPEVRRLYQNQLARTQRSTRVRDFLPILIGRRVGEELRQHRRADAPVR